MQTKNCSTCAHKAHLAHLGFDVCMKTGRDIRLTRRDSTTCDENFSAWEKKQGIFTRLFYWLFG